MSCTFVPIVVCCIINAGQYTIYHVGGAASFLCIETLHWNVPCFILSDGGGSSGGCNCLSLEL